jgi:hypothetical protein
LNFEDEAKQDLILFETIAATKGFESAINFMLAQDNSHLQSKFI